MSDSDPLTRLNAALEGRYRIERELGQGGMATVYLADDLKHERKVALKVLKPELAATVGQDRFLREIRVIAKLQHPHILPLFESGTADSFLYYVMPYIEGETLRQRLEREKQLSIEQALEITKVVGGALDFAHARSIVHRDIKPENILLQDGVALVADFGIAVAVSTAGGDRLTDTGMSLGTPAYMSPEQIAGERDLDGRSDVYSLACVTYEMLAGDPPFIASNPLAVLAKHVTDPAPPVTTARPSVSAAAASSLAKALSKAPADRQQTAGDFVAELHALAAPEDDESPSIAVLPFDNMSDDPAQEYFSDGMSEDLTAALSRFDWLFVVARNSAFTYRGGAIDLKRVGSELGVRYILEGSVRRSGNRVRVNVQLIDARSGRQVWAERFDREMDDVFELQDDIVARLAGTLGPEITLAEIERTRRKRPEIFNAWDHYLQATAAYHRMTKEDLDIAISHLETAIEIEPEFANTYALLGLCYAKIGIHGWLRPARQAYEKARRLVENSVRLAPSSAEANYALAFVLMMTGEAKNAVIVSRRAIELNPNFAEAYAVLGHALVFCGDLEGGLDACRRAERSSPRDSRGSWLYDAMGHAYFFLGEYERAIEVSKRGLSRDPSLIGALVTLACAYAQLGREEEATRYVEELVEYVPRYSLRALRKNPMFVDPELVDRLVESMRLAGLPD